MGGNSNVICCDYLNGNPSKDVRKLGPNVMAMVLEDLDDELVKVQLTEPGYPKMVFDILKEDIEIR
jgi:hypothetical protein